MAAAARFIKVLVRLKPDTTYDSSGLSEKRARQSIEKVRQRLALERESAGVRRPRELIASCHGRHPDLAHRCVGRHDEFRLDRLLEYEIQHAVLELDLEAFGVRQRQERTPCGFERRIAFHSEFLLR